MIDSIKLNLDFPIVDKNKVNVTVTPSPVDLTTGLLIAEYKLFQTGFFNAEYGKEAECYVGNMRLWFNQYGKFIQFSIPKKHYGEHNYYPVNKSQAMDVIDRMNDHLNHGGVEVDLWNSNLSRVDIFKNIVTDHPFDSYNQVFDLLHGTRLNKWKSYTSYYFGNKYRALAIYDKINQMKHEGIDVSKFPEHVMRVEYRMYTGKYCFDGLGTKSIRGLFEIWDQLPVIYKEKVNQILFSNNKVENMTGITCNTEAEKIEWFRNMGDRNWFNNYQMAYGARDIMDQFENDDELRKILLPFKDKSTVSNILKKMRATIIETSPIINNNISVGELYAELKNKILSDELKAGL